PSQFLLVTSVLLKSEECIQPSRLLLQSVTGQVTLPGDVGIVVLVPVPDLILADIAVEAEVETMDAGAQVTDTRVLIARRSRGFGFVYFNHVTDAKAAKSDAHGMEIDGRSIRCDFSITDRPHSPTPGIYMGRPTRRGGPRRRSNSRGRYSRSRSRSRSYDRK
ncbi:Transformer-2 protein beta, partial [Fasciola hepatica]